MRPVDRDAFLRRAMRLLDRGAFSRPDMGPLDRDALLRPASGAAAGAGGLDTGRRSSTPRPGWYPYRVTGTAELPSWAVEIALTIERPAASTVEAYGRGPAGGEPEPAPELQPGGGRAQAMLVLRVPGRLPWLGGVADAIAEVETAAGIRPADPEDDLVEGPGRRGPRLLTGPILPGLAPATATAACAHLRIAASRGLPAPLRRRRPATAGGGQAWRAGAGCVLTCDGPEGRSAQAVVALHGAGNPAAIAPPPGGALILRAWRTGAGCGIACGLVLGASATLGLGREARRVAAAARSEGWGASVLTGSAAVLLARAGDPRRPAPQDVGLATTRTQVAAMFAACLIGADIAADRRHRHGAGLAGWTVAP